MGQYHYLVNLDKKQVVHPHQIGNGLKLREQVGWDYSTSTVLVMLLAASNKGGARGGGDFHTEHELIGSWAGDRIAFIGDYAEKDDLPGADAREIHNLANAACYPEGYGPSNKDITAEFVAEAAQWKNISAQVREMMSQAFDIAYTGDGWMNIEGQSGEKSEPALAPDMVIKAK